MLPDLGVLFDFRDRDEALQIEIALLVFRRVTGVAVLLQDRSHGCLKRGVVGSAADSGECEEDARRDEVHLKNRALGWLMEAHDNPQSGCVAGGASACW